MYANRRVRYATGSGVASKFHLLKSNPRPSMIQCAVVHQLRAYTSFYINLHLQILLQANYNGRSAITVLQTIMTLLQ